MKKILISIISLFFIVNFADAQDCLSLYKHKKGTKIEMTDYDKKGKVTGKSVETVLSRSKEKISLQIESYDIDADTVNFTSEYDMFCKNGNIYVSMKSYMDSKQMAAYQGMDIAIDASDIEMPSHPKSGQKLNDGNIKIVITNQGVKMMTLTIDITNRKVEKRENITTPAGTFDCYKLTYDISSKIGFIKVNGSAAEWYSEGVGKVKSENYNKKGKLMSYSELTSIKN